ncbi:MAG TPA: mobilization protein [Polyangia bacterium]
MSKIHFVGGDKGGVGKSVVARCLVSWCLEHRHPLWAVDADSSHASLQRHYPEVTLSVDLSRLEGLDEIFTSACQTDRRVIVDVPAQGDRAVAGWLAEGKVLELAATSGVEVVFWHVMDDGKDAITTLGLKLERHPPPARHVIVENLGRGFRFAQFDQSPVRAAAEAASAMTIQLPELYPPVMRKLDRADAGYEAVINDAEFAADLFTKGDRQRLKLWLSACFGQFARVGDWL